MNDEHKLKIRWQNKVEKFASEEDRIKGKAQEVIEWESEDNISLADALALLLSTNDQTPNSNLLELGACDLEFILKEV